MNQPDPQDDRQEYTLAFKIALAVAGIIVIGGLLFLAWLQRGNP